MSHPLLNLIDFSKCCVCGEPCENGKQLFDDDPDKSIPLCLVCHESGKIHSWFDKAVAEIKEWSGKYAIPSSEYSMNIYADLLMIRAHNTHEARMEDGVCPNGCALMNDLGGGDFECPACHFHLMRRTL